MHSKTQTCYTSSQQVRTGLLRQVNIQVNIQQVCVCCYINPITGSACMERFSFVCVCVCVVTVFKRYDWGDDGHACVSVYGFRCCMASCECVSVCCCECGPACMDVRHFCCAPGNTIYKDGCGYMCVYVQAMKGSQYQTIRGQSLRQVNTPMYTSPIPRSTDKQSVAASHQPTYSQPPAHTASLSQQAARHQPMHSQTQPTGNQTQADARLASQVSSGCGYMC